MTSSFTSLDRSRYLLVALGAALCLSAACGNSNSSGTAGSAGSAATSGATTSGPSGSSSSGSTSGTGGSSTTSSTGTSTSTGTTSSGTGGSTGQSCSSLPLCDDFESDTVGSAPSSSLWTLLNTKGCSGSSPYAIAVDSAQAHSGTHSIKVTGGDSCGPLMVNTTAFSKLSGGNVFGRFFVRLPSEPAFVHASLMTLGLTANADTAGQSLNQSTHLQLAAEEVGSSNVLVWQTTDSNILPDKDTMGGSATTYPAADTWTCIEFETAASGAIQTWVDGNAVAGLTFVPGTTAKTTGVNDQWTAPASFAPTSLGLGWIAFSAPQIVFWIDDVALASSRIGCTTM